MYAQADLRLCWSHIPYCWKSHALEIISILYTRSGVTEICDESYPKTLDGNTNHLNTQTPTEAYKIRHNEQMKSTDSGAEVIDSKQIQIKGTSFGIVTYIPKP